MCNNYIMIMVHMSHLEVSHQPTCRRELSSHVLELSTAQQYRDGIFYPFFLQHHFCGWFLVKISHLQPEIRGCAIVGASAFCAAVTRAFAMAITVFEVSQCPLFNCALRGDLHGEWSKKRIQQSCTPLG